MSSLIRMKSIARKLGWATVGCLITLAYQAQASQKQSCKLVKSSTPGASAHSFGGAGFAKCTAGAQPPVSLAAESVGKKLGATGTSQRNKLLLPGIVPPLTPGVRRPVAAEQPVSTLAILDRAGNAGFYQAGLDCGPSNSAEGSYGDAAVSAKNDETLRRLGLCGFTLWAWDQQNGQTPKKKRNYSPSATEGSPRHIFWVVPAFKVDYQNNFKPLTSREKFDEWAQSAYDPLGLAAGAFEAALEHSPQGGFCDYGHGFGGYAKCFGSAELDANISSFFGDFVFTVLLHQDPRYFRLGEGSFATRTWYAISRVFVTHSDSGRTVFYSSALSGTVLGAAASNLYYPVQDRGFGLTLSRIGWDLGDTALYNWSAEFWPDINHKLHQVF
jgi:hypothetical protein